MTIKASFPLLLILVLIFPFSCQTERGEKLPLNLVRRSVLDQKIRMLSLGFGEDRYAAYDLENARLDKIWRGGILWNGAVFNNLKSVQPESYGPAYWERPNATSEWTLEEQGEQRPVEIQFKSYYWKEEVIRLEFFIMVDTGQKIIIKEKPQFINKSEGLFFQRHFTASGMKPNQKLYFHENEIHPQKGFLLDEALESLPEGIPPALPVSTSGSQYWLDRSGCNTCHAKVEKIIGPSYEAIAERYSSDSETLQLLVARVRYGSTGQWGNAAMVPHPDLMEKDIERMVQYILSLDPEEGNIAKKKVSKSKEQVQPKVIPGFGHPVAGVHPSFDLVNFRPANFKPRVGGLAFLPDGQLLVSTWDSIGAVYALKGVETGDSNQVIIKQIASGLSEPLGLTTVGEDIFVLQKHELSQLIDSDQDGLIEEYRSIHHSFGATPDFHEFSYGLVFQNGHFYGTLGLAMRLMSSELQHPDRGRAFKAGLDGSFEFISTGLRQPNGIGLGPEGDIFLTENQGQWSPACKVIHLKADKFYGCQYGTGDRFHGLRPTPPAVWLPQDEIGNSPSQPVFMPSGPYAGHMIYGEVTHGGLKRVFLEKIKGDYQGCVFRFSQGLEAGVNRLAWGPDGALYVGGVGMNGNWTHKGKQFGLQKLVINGQAPFEILALRSRPDGFEMEFTHPISMEALINIQKKIKVQQWYYEATAAYGGPKLDLQDLRVRSLESSENGRRLQLKIPGLKKGYIIYFYLDPGIVSESGEQLWNGETWYTLNNIPEEKIQ